MQRRLTVLGIGLAFGVGFSLLVAGSWVPSHTSTAKRVFAWASVMSGPIIGSACGLNDHAPLINIGWLGLFLVPSHALCPNKITGSVTLLGFLLWYFAGLRWVIAEFWA
jgi:hypothetical protein